MDPVLLHAYAPGHRETDQCHCWTALTRIRKTFEVLDVPCPGPDDYERALAELWGARTIVTVEHDIAPRIGMVRALLACPHPVCAQAYRIYPVSTNLDFVPYCALVREPNGGRRWLVTDEEWADECGLGLTKIDLSVQQDIPVSELQPFSGLTWQSLDTRVMQALAQRGIRYHMHFPSVPHHNKGSRKEKAPLLIKSAVPQPLCQKCTLFARGSCRHLQNVLRDQGPSAAISSCSEHRPRSTS